MKLTEKEKGQILKNGAEAMSKIIERMSIEMRELEEENKKLKEELNKYKEQYQHSMGFSDFGGYDEDEHIVKDENTYRDLDL